MLKSAYEASPLSVSREALLEAAKRFLRRLAGDIVLIPVENITSPDYGASDLALVKKDRTGLTVARLHQKGDFPKFAMLTAAYHCWLKDCTQISGEILNQAIGLDTYLISDDVPSADSYLLKALSKIARLSFIKYQILDIEEQQMPVVRFKLLDVAPSGKHRFDRKRDHEEAGVVDIKEGQAFPDHRLSSLEMDEFNRLKELYL